MSNPAIGLRLPEDLRAAIAQAAENEGVSVSEWIRGMLYKLVYNEPLGITEGYAEGRRVGYSVVIQLAKGAIKEAPETIEDAMQIAQLGNPGNGRNGRRG